MWDFFQLTYLSHFATGMRHLEQVLAAIWNHVCANRLYAIPSTDTEFWSIDKQYFHKTVHQMLSSNLQGI